MLCTGLPVLLLLCTGMMAGILCAGATQKRVEGWVSPGLSQHVSHLQPSGPSAPFACSQISLAFPRQAVCLLPLICVSFLCGNKIVEDLGPEVTGNLQRMAGCGVIAGGDLMRLNILPQLRLGKEFKHIGISTVCSLVAPASCVSVVGQTQKDIVARLDS